MGFTSFSATPLLLIREVKVDEFLGKRQRKVMHKNKWTNSVEHFPK